MKVIPVAPVAPQAITVNGVHISPQAIAAEAQNHPMPKGKPGWAWRAAAQALVLREVLLQEARRRALVAQPKQVGRGQWETDEEALIRQLLEADIAPAPVSEAELYQIYCQSTQRFRGPSLYEAAHILFASKPDDHAADAQNRQRASTVLAELKQRPARFAALAAEHSACPSREHGGLLGQLSSGDTVPEFEAVLAALVVGTLSPEPVKTRYGYHIVRLDARETGDVLPFAAVLPQLRDAQEKRHWLHEGQRLTQALAAKASIQGIDLLDAPWTAAKQL